MGEFDIHFQPVPAEEATGFKCFEFGFQSALKVKGPQSLVNRWVKTLMTPLGSDPIEPTAGTTFGNLIGFNITSVSADMRDLMVMAIEDASDQVREQDLQGFFPDNERLQSAELMDFIEVPAGFEVWVLIKNVAGDALPVPLVTLATR